MRTIKISQGKKVILRFGKLKYIIQSNTNVIFCAVGKSVREMGKLMMSHLLKAGTAHRMRRSAATCQTSNSPPPHPKTTQKITQFLSTLRKNLIFMCLSLIKILF